MNDSFFVKLGAVAMVESTDTRIRNLHPEINVFTGHNWTRIPPGLKV